jgi:hypothetical protein
MEETFCVFIAAYRTIWYFRFNEAGFSMLFRGSSIYTAKLRNTDDPLNYAVGGGLTGAIVGFSSNLEFIKDQVVVLLWLIQ